MNQKDFDAALEAAVKNALACGLDMYDPLIRQRFAAALHHRLKGGRGTVEHHAAAAIEDVRTEAKRDELRARYKDLGIENNPDALGDVAFARPDPAPGPQRPSVDISRLNDADELWAAMKDGRVTSSPAPVIAAPAEDDIRKINDPEKLLEIARKRGQKL